VVNSPLKTRQYIPYYKEVRVFKYTGFSRFADKEGITDNELLEIVDQLEGDQADANLGGDVYKVRVDRHDTFGVRREIRRIPRYSVL
jgi:hypothetical protein